jgi:amino acid transporter
VIAGEIKGVKKALPVALILSLVFGIAYWSITSWLTLKATGEDWMYAVGYLWDNNATAYSSAMPYPPTQPLLLALISYPNQALTALAIITYLVGSAVAPFVYFWIPTRYFFAWSFDRLIPTRFANVHEKYHAPHYSIAAISALAAVLFLLYYFTSWPTGFALGTFLWGVAFVIPGLAALVLPARRPELLQAAPSFMARKVAGMPVLSWLGLLTAISFAYLGYIAITNPLISTPTTLGVEVVAGIIIITLAIYFASRAYYARRGLDISLVFREIPPE